MGRSITARSERDPPQTHGDFESVKGRRRSQGRWVLFSRRARPR